MSREPDAAAAARLAGGLTETEREVLATVDQRLAEGLELYRWWCRAERDHLYQRIPIVRQLNRPDWNYGFLSEAPLRRGLLPVLGVIQEMFYDRPKAAARGEQTSIEWYRAQIETFAQCYFLRIGSRPRPRLPGAGEEPGGAAESGWAFQQVFYKLRRSGTIGAFPPAERFRIVDLRNLFSNYEWVIFKVRLFDFSLTRTLLGVNGPRLEVPLDPVVWVVTHHDLCGNRQNPEPGVLGEYGGGWAVIPISDPSSLMAYGPPHFDTAFEFIHFRVLADGEVRVKIAFVSNQPNRLLNFDPVEWGLRFADLASFGIASRVLAPVTERLARLRLFPAVGPIVTSIALANTLTGGIAARQFGISEARFYRDIMVEHFMGLYDFVLQTIPTWCRIPDWCDAKNLPPWVVEGYSPPGGERGGGIV